MNLEIILGIVRHVLTFGGGFLVTKGVASTSEVELYVGALVTLIGGVWSVWHKLRKPA